MRAKMIMEKVIFAWSGGKGELANGKFKPYFLEGTKFSYHPRQHSQLDTSSIIIYMPKPGYELMVEENN